jgi:hypothetical protein
VTAAEPGGPPPEVALVRVRPDHVDEDVARALELARPALDPLEDTLLVLHPPAPGEPPEGGTRAGLVRAATRWLIGRGHVPRGVLAVAPGPDDEAIVQGAAARGWLRALRDEGVRLVPLADVDWIEYPFKRTYEALRRRWPREIPVPKLMPGKQLVHLLPPALPPEGAVGAGRVWLPWTEVARLAPDDAFQADVLQMEREVAPAQLACLDLGGVAPGVDFLLASRDPVALDAAHARLFGREAPHVARAAGRKLGSAEGTLVGDPFPGAPLGVAAPARGLIDRLKRITR